MNAKRLRNALLVACIPLFISGCGDKTPEGARDTGIAPASLSDTLKVKRSSKTYIITGIGLRGTNKVAIINDTILKPGEEIDPGVVLKDIQPTYAVILYGNTEHLIRPENIQAEINRKKH